MSKSNYHRKYARIGPGGWHCNCCAPAPGKAKKLFLRFVKRSERIRAKLDIEDQLI